MQKVDRHICAVIPTYNNAGTLADIVHRVYQYVEDIIVVADGPTDNTLEVLAGLNIPLYTVSYETNKGKGYALKRGFQKARELGFSHALTIDSDGQHYPEDIPSMYRMHAIHPRAIIIGSRQMKQENKPARNTFANRFSNFWFAVQTGTYLPDTQTGFRIYPLHEIHGEWAMTRRYEAELALLVFSAWANVPMLPVPVRVYYPPREKRISHFRPAYDFTRISILNTLLCVLAVCYGLPRRWIWCLMYYAAFGIDALFAMYPSYFWLRIRYGNTPLMHEKLHKVMQRCSMWFMKCMPNTPYNIRTVEGATPVDESKPCVMIANHSSFIDTLMVMTLHTKVSIMTAGYVTKHILFGPISRSFDILPAYESIDDLLPVIEERVKQGFSVMIYPEGTRTKTGELGRFHRGAFYIAERLKLPIRPLLLRGSYTAHNKVQQHTDFPPEFSINILPEVQPNDTTFGADYRERSKAFAAYYRERLDTYKYNYAE